MNIKLVVQHQYEASVKKTILTTHKIKKKINKAESGLQTFSQGKKEPKPKQQNRAKGNIRTFDFVVSVNHLV